MDKKYVELDKVKELIDIAKQNAIVSDDLDILISSIDNLKTFDSSDILPYQNFVKKIYADGKSFTIATRCPKCGANLAKENTNNS